MSKHLIRIELEGELARMLEFIKKAHKLKTNGETLRTLIADDIKCSGNTVEILISKKFYQQIWRLIKEFDLNYLSVEEFVQETFKDILKSRWKALGKDSAEIRKEKVLAYIV